MWCTVGGEVKQYNLTKGQRSRRQQSSSRVFLAKMEIWPLYTCLMPNFSKLNQ